MRECACVCMCVYVCEDVSVHVVAVPLVRAALAAHNGMVTFAEAAVAQAL